MRHWGRKAGRITCQLLFSEVQLQGDISKLRAKNKGIQMDVFVCPGTLQGTVISGVVSHAFLKRATGLQVPAMLASEKQTNCHFAV